MVRSSVKNTSEKQSTVTTPAVANLAPVNTVVETSSSKASRTKKASKVAETVAAPVVVEQPVATQTVTSETPVEVSDSLSLSVKMTEFSAKLQQLVGLFSTVKNDFKTLEKTVAREMKNAQKASSKRKRSNVARKPSGFIKPTRISDELADFLGKSVGTEMARTSVSKEINQYIREHSLQDPKNGRKIYPDDKLSKLLKISKEDELTYFNLQRYMKHHFIKATPSV